MVLGQTGRPGVGREALRGLRGPERLCLVPQRPPGCPRRCCLSCWASPRASCTPASDAAARQAWPSGPSQTPPGTARWLRTEGPRAGGRQGAQPPCPLPAPRPTGASRPAPAGQGPVPQGPGFRGLPAQGHPLLSPSPRQGPPPPPPASPLGRGLCPGAATGERGPRSAALCPSVALATGHPGMWGQGGRADHGAKAPGGPPTGPAPQGAPLLIIRLGALGPPRLLGHPRAPSRAGASRWGPALRTAQGALEQGPGPRGRSGPGKSRGGGRPRPVGSSGESPHPRSSRGRAAFPPGDRVPVWPRLSGEPGKFPELPALPLNSPRETRSRTGSRPPSQQPGAAWAWSYLRLGLRGPWGRR